MQAGRNCAPTATECKRAPKRPANKDRDEFVIIHLVRRRFHTCRKLMETGPEEEQFLAAIWRGGAAGWPQQAARSIANICCATWANLEH